MKHRHLFKLLELKRVMKNWKINHKGKNAERNGKDQTQDGTVSSQCLYGCRALMAVARMKGKGGIPGGLLSGDVRQTHSHTSTQNQQSMEMKGHSGDLVSR